MCFLLLIAKGSCIGVVWLQSYSWILQLIVWEIVHKLREWRKNGVLESYEGGLLMPFFSLSFSLLFSCVLNLNSQTRRWPKRAETTLLVGKWKSSPGTYRRVFIHKGVRGCYRNCMLLLLVLSAYLILLFHSEFSLQP